MGSLCVCLDSNSALHWSMIERCIIVQVSDTVVRVHEVTTMMRHPGYNEVTYDNDIALWRLKNPADLHHFRTICLPSPGKDDHVMLTSSLDPP